MTADENPREAGMETYFATLRQHRRTALTVVAVAVLAGVFVSSLAPRRYDATAKVILGQQEQVDVVLGTAQTSADPERDLNTNVALIGLDSVADGVRSRLRTDESAEGLLAQVKIAVDGNSDIVSITAGDADPRRAAAIANAFADGYQQFRERTDQAAVNAALAKAEDRLRTLPPGGERDALSTEVRRLQVAAAFETGGVQIVRRAIPPASPSRPRPLLSAVVAGFLGLLLAGAIIVFKARSDRRVRTEAELERTLGRPLLATLPAGRGRRRREATQEGLISAAARLSYGSHPPRVLLLTSPGPGEGTADVALGLAAAFAALGRRAIAIEADLRHPVFCERIDARPRVGGLVALLRDGGTVSRELITVGQSLDSGIARVLPAGTARAHPQALLAGTGMAAVVTEARWKADVVLLAAAPADVFGDALTLAPLADAALLVARIGATRGDAALRVLAALEAVETPLAGVVAITGAGDLEPPPREQPAPSAARPQPSPTTERVGPVTAPEAAV